MDFKTISVFSRDYSKFSVDNFRDDFSIQNFNVEFEDVNDQSNDFYFKIEGCANIHAPLKKLNSKETKLKQKPWISKELIKLIKIRNRLFQRKKRQPNNLNVKKLYNLFRNRINRQIKKSRKTNILKITVII